MVTAMVMNDLITPLCSMSICPPILRYSYFKIWPWKSLVKYAVMYVVKGEGHIRPWKFKGQGHGQGQTLWSHLRPGVQPICLLFLSLQLDPFWLRYGKFHIWPWKFKVKVMAKVKSDGHNWGLKLNWYVCFSCPGNRTIFDRDKANSMFDLENSRSRSWSWSNPMVTFEALRPIDMFAFCFVAIFDRDKANSMFDLENSRSRSWSWSNPMVTFEALRPIDMFAFCFVAIGPFLAEIWQIPYLTLKIQGQGHGQGQTQWSHLRPRVQAICLLFVSWQWDHFWLRHSGGGGVRTGRKTSSHPRYTGLTSKSALSKFGNGLIISSFNL